MPASPKLDTHELELNPFSTSDIENCNKGIPSKIPDEQYQPKSLCNRYRILIGIVIICAIIATAVTVAPETTALGRLDPTLWLPSLLDHLDFNPHGGDSPFDFSLWNMGRGCGGLEISVIDNLEARWKPFLSRAIADWDNGEPDAITINVREISTYDPECTHRRNLLKVCNGNYGNTDWVGVNIAIVIQDFISSSVAKMNDYHLDNMAFGAKQWTMCHELGHGFGLGHWDERFYNRDLGNCMDYTARTRKESNQKPGTSNFEFLELMYGNVDGSSRYSPTTVVNGTDRLHCSSADLFERRSLVSISDEEFARYLKYVPTKPRRHHHQAHMGWKLLSKNEYQEIHELEIEDSVKIVTTLHLV